MQSCDKYDFDTTLSKFGVRERGNGVQLMMTNVTNS